MQETDEATKTIALQIFMAVSSEVGCLLPKLQLTTVKHKMKMIAINFQFKCLALTWRSK